MYYIVKCMDDDGHFVMATHKLFTDRRSATIYRQTISPARHAFVAPVEIEMVEDTEDAEYLEWCSDHQPDDQ